MNLEDLRAAQVDERETDSLQALPSSFYEQAADYLADLRGRRDRLAERTDDPFGSEAVRQLTDELETATEVVEALYERRVGKIVKQASLAAAGMPADDEGLTEAERTLFADLVERIEQNRQTVLAVLGPPDGTDDRREARGAAAEPPDGRPAEPTAPDANQVDPDEGSSATDPSADETGRPGADPDPDGGGTESTGADATDEPARTRVRITADVGEIYGVDDRVYTLGTEDVVTLPAANAEPLLDRGAAERVE